MNNDKWPELEDDYRKWTGGFPPDSPHEITVYIDYANPFEGREDDVRDYLTDWLELGDEDLNSRFLRGWLQS
ncbi:MAG: hypothetical protein SFU86_10100 [Pirellulaceae bacterium]|nr:hypothetical protein [Pirellulaceae bacterium]